MGALHSDIRLTISQKCMWRVFATFLVEGRPLIGLIEKAMKGTLAFEFLVGHELQCTYNDLCHLAVLV